MTLKGVTSGRKGSHTYTEALSCLQAQRTASFAERSAETSLRLHVHMASSVGGIIHRDTLQADGAPPDDFRGLTEVNL